MSAYLMFERSADQYPKRTCIRVNDRDFSYMDVQQMAVELSTSIPKNADTSVAILAYRSLSVYIGILGAIRAGRPYVPLSPKFPSSRNVSIINLAKSDCVVVGRECVEDLFGLVEHLDKKTTLIFPELHRNELPVKIAAEFKCIFKDSHVALPVEQSIADASDLTYIIFTSGSTGTPKGVPISHNNLWSYVKYMSERYELTYEDRFSQTFDITFDVSVHDMFVCWYVGGMLCVLPEEEMLAPHRFIKNNEITAWFSVPSMVKIMHRLRLLKAGSFPKLRFSFFVGEPLPLSVFQAWRTSAPNSICSNIYGPAEATIGVSHYDVEPDTTEVDSFNGVVAIGHVFSTMDYQIEGGNQTSNYVEGELCLAGPQLAAGYWKNTTLSESKFVELNDDGTKWYRTGDIVREFNGLLYYVERKDFMVKVRGFRIELEEINNAVASITGASEVYSLPYPVVDGIADSIYTFVSTVNPLEHSELIVQLKELLPEYMVPKSIFSLESLPLNANGKVDRKQLANILIEKGY